MKKWLLVIVILFLVSSTMVSANLLFNSCNLSPTKDGEIEVETEAHVNTIGEKITKARLDYWWDENVVHTYIYPERFLGQEWLYSVIYFDKSELPLNETIHFNLIIETNKGDKIEQEQFIYYTEPFNWNKIPWKTIESNHIILRYKLAKDNIAKQILDIAEDAYLGVSKMLKEEVKEKIPVIVLDTYEQLCLEPDIPDGHWGGCYSGTSIWIRFEPSCYYEDPGSLKRTIAHEITHIFQSEFFFTAYNSSNASIWFSDVMAQYVSTRVAFRDEIGDEIRKSFTSKRLIKDISSPYWKYSQSMKVLFFDYLFDKYQTKEVTQVVRAFVKSEDFRNVSLSKDFFSYLSSKYSLHSDISKKVGLQTLGDTIPNNFCSYNASKDKALIFMYSGLYNLDYIDDDIGILDLKDMKITNLTRNFLYEGDPIWSKDEKSIYYVMKNGPEYFIMEMSLEDKNIRKIYTSGDFISDLSLFPDGKKIIFSKQEDLYRTSLWLLGLKDKEAKQITSGKYLDISPVFYKNNEILFISDRINNTKSIFKMNLNELKPSIIPDTTDSSKIIDVSDNKCLFRIMRDHYFDSISIINLQNGRVKRYFGEGCSVPDIWDIWFPGLYNGKLCYYEGESLKELIPKEIPLD